MKFRKFYHFFSQFIAKSIDIALNTPFRSMTRSGNFRFFLWELPRWLRRFGRGGGNLEMPLFWPDFSALPKNSDFDLAVK